MNKTRTFFAALAGAVLVLLIVEGPALASSIKSWAGGETITANDLNANFSHIHGTMVGGHGARLVNADVSASAAIAHSKLATPSLVPKAWGVVKSTCAASPCTVDAHSGISSVTRGGAGTYTVNLSSARANTNYGVLVSSVNPSGATGTLCIVEPIIATTNFSIDCYTHAGAANDTGLTFMVLDNDN